MMSWCTCLTATNRVRIIVVADLGIALMYTIYRVTTYSLLLRKVFGRENGQLTSPELNELKPEDITILKYSTVFLLTLAVVGLAFEIFLFFLLNNGVRSKNYRHCKHWFIIRILLLIVSILGSVVQHVRSQYYLIDGLLEVEKLYRIVTLLVVGSFMQEIYKGMADNTYEENYQNSFAIVDGYPNGLVSTNIIRSHHSHSNF